MIDPMTDHNDGPEASAASAALEETPAAANAESLREDIATTRAAISEKIEALQGKVRSVGTRARQSVDLRYQFEQHPWAALGVSLAAGFVAGSLGRAAAATAAPAVAATAAPAVAPVVAATAAPVRAATAAPAAAVSPAPDAAATVAPDAAAAQPPAAPARTARSELFGTLKLAMGAALMDLARQALHKQMPALGTQLDKIWEGRGLSSISAASALLSSDRPASQG